MDTILTIVIIFCVLVLISTFIIMWGWSWFMVPVFGMAPLTFTQAFGFSLLANCIGRTGTSSK